MIHKIKRVISDPVYRQRNISKLRKRLAQPFRPEYESKAIFVLGKQRSGTTMLMNCFHRHPGTVVFDEDRNNAAFDDFLIRDFEKVNKIIQNARYPAVCFKPICDSHRITEFYHEIPNNHIIWMYRHYNDVANSSLRNFGSPTRAVKLVCTGQPGGGWFQEGVSPGLVEILRDVYHPQLSEFDFSCLIWWARNRIIIDSGFIGDPKVTLVQYETLVSEPQSMFKWLFGQIGLEYDERIIRKVFARSIGRHDAPDLDPRVRELCADTLETLDTAFKRLCPYQKV